MYKVTIGTNYNTEIVEIVEDLEFLEELLRRYEPYISVNVENLERDKGMVYKK